MADLTQAAEQIGLRIGSLLGDEPYPKIVLGQQISVYLFRENSVGLGHPANLSHYSNKTDVIHHQIIINDVACGYARMKHLVDGSGNNYWEFRSMAISETAYAIDVAYEALTEHGSKRKISSWITPVRLLILPQHHVTLLWREGDSLTNDQVAVVESPSNSLFKLLNQFDGSEFLKTLRSEPVAAGLEIDGDEDGNNG